MIKHLSSEHSDKCKYCRIDYFRTTTPDGDIEMECDTICEITGVGCQNYDFSAVEQCAKEQKETQEWVKKYEEELGKEV